MAEQRPVPELSDLLSTLKGVNWRELGIHLSVPSNTLGTIKRESDAEVDRLAEMLQYCLDNGEVSWEKIIKALKKMSHHGKIISTIESTYITPGQQKSQVNNSDISAVSTNGLETNDSASTEGESEGALHNATSNELLVTRVEEISKDQKPYDMDGSKEIEIGGERYSLDVIPAAESKVVADEKEDLLGAVDLRSLVDDLGRAGAFIRVAYNGVMAAGPQYTELQIEIQELGFDITRLCNESALTVSKFKTASSMVLSNLKATYGFLLHDKVDVAIETLSSVSKLAGKMEKAAFELHSKFEQEEKKVTTALKKTQKAGGEAAVCIEKKEKEKQQFQIQLQHQQRVLEDAQRVEHEAEAQRQQIEAKENEAISEIKHIGVFKSLVNAIFRYEVFDEGTKKVDRLREKRIQASENERKLRKERLAAMERMTSFTIMIQNCQSEQEMAKVTVDALHKTAQELRQLSVIMMQAAQFWKQMNEYCKLLAEERVQQMIREIKSEESKADRIKTWTLKPFKEQAIRFYAGWVALNTVCCEYVERIKETQKELYKYIVENPTYEEARRNIHDLAENFLAVLKKDQETIAQKDFKDQKEIEASDPKQD